MSDRTQEQLIIIGSGPASLTAAIYASRANLHPLVIEGKSPGGQLIKTTAVENWPGDISVLGPVLMQRMKDHAEHYGTRFLSEDVTEIDTHTYPFTLVTSKQKRFTAASVIIATGAQAKQLHIPGEKEYVGKGVSNCAVCDGAFFKNRSIIIVGGGDTAMETASFMTKFTNKITIVHLLDTFTASAIMQQRVLNDPNIAIIYNSTVTEIRGNNDHVTEAIITHQQTKAHTILPTEGLFVAIGYSPNSTIFKNQIKLDEWGYVVVHENTKTSIDGIFAAGDVVDHHYRQAVTASASGCMAALDAEQWLRSKG